MTMGMIERPGNTLSSTECDARSLIGMRRHGTLALVFGLVVAMVLSRNAGPAPVSNEAGSYTTMTFVPARLASFDEPQRGQVAKSRDTNAPVARRQLRLGETPVDVVTSRPLDSKHLYCNLHDDENTAVEAGLLALRRLQGRLVELQHGGKRDITFQLEGEAFAVDPNRIFTTAGIQQTLSRLSHRTAKAEQAVERFAQDLLSIYSLERTAVVIALHNNSERAYSALSYAQGGMFASDAADVFIEDGSDPDDFFYVTEAAVFDALRRRGYNVVLQDNRRVRDDGSLSVYCGRAGVRYINIEAQHGHLDQQVAMIFALHDALEAVGQSRSK
jgi:hypothetical protein